jgi:hypothetical protein
MRQDDSNVFLAFFAAWALLTGLVCWFLWRIMGL